MKETLIYLLYYIKHILWKRLVRSQYQVLPLNFIYIAQIIKSNVLMKGLVHRNYILLHYFIKNQFLTSDRYRVNYWNIYFTLWYTLL